SGGPFRRAARFLAREYPRLRTLITGLNYPRKAHTMSSYTAPTGYRHTLHITFRFADMDAMGHVDNATYLTYFESARIAYALEIFRLGDVAQLGMILAKLTVEFKLPLTLGDEIVVYTRCSRLGTKSFDLEAQILRYQAGETQVAATGPAVMV